MKDLWSCKDIIIQNADKGNSIVILNKKDYIKRMTKMLSDIEKKLNFKLWEKLKLLLEQEDLN